MTKDPLLYFSQAACKALLYEVTLTPKPGLVDCANDGSHSDMTLSTFIDSTAALIAHFYRYLRIGYDHASLEPQLLFNLLRQEGIAAEQSMFEVTKGINTHKGVNFSFALLLGATGSYLAQHPEKSETAIFTADDTVAICKLVKPLTKHLIDQDLHHLSKKEHLTYGEELFLKYGIKGPRGEAASGYPSLTQHALPFLREEASKTSDNKYLQLKLLLHLMTFVEDANLIHRGGMSALRAIQKETKEIEAENLSPSALCQKLTNYNDHLVRLHLSPGGSADLLALSLYFAFLENII
ncbi:triphosphoribosyl-dephospho-CoA synthase CitG [Streptococcus hongkongensis]|nr:2-(5'-triphosphoribosyl)-3'-dephospho CoA synthase [Streptococcus uberis]